MSTGIKIAQAGTEALLLDAAGSDFSDEIQERIWALSKLLSGQPGITEVVPGMNNLLVTYDALHNTACALPQALHELWSNTSRGAVEGRTIEIAVTYGGADGEDLALLAEHCKMPAEEVVRRHTEATYRVSAIGAMPGFPYLSGLDPLIAMPRRETPRARVAKGAVILGGAQTGVMPTNAPSGWHILGRTEITLFDASRSEPSLLAPGDIVRFKCRELLQ